MKRIYLLSTFALMLCGVMIWSCSQEETENIGKVYRYSPEEISKLRSMADEYGIPNVKFITVSATELPTMNEMKEAMYKFSLLKHSISMPMELVDSSSTNIVYQSKRVTFDRLRHKRASGGEGASQDFDVTVENCRATLSFNVHWTPIYKEGEIIDYSLTVSGSLELPIQLEPWYYYRNFKISYDKRPYEAIIPVTFKCDLIFYDLEKGKEFLIEELEFIKNVNVPIKPSL